MRDRIFGRLGGKVKAKRIGAFDTEGVPGEGGFVLGVTVTESERCVFHDARAMVDYLLSHRHRDQWWFAHNLAYDLAVLLPYFPPGMKLYLIQSGVFKAEYDDGHRNRVHFRDSQRMWAHASLAALGKVVGMAKYPTPPSLTGEDGGVPEWYCDAHGEKWCVECYCLRDAEIVYRAMMVYQDTLLSLGGDLSTTVASTAMRLFRRSYLDTEYVPPRPYQNAFAREGYYGGRTEAFVLGERHGVNLYDFHSAYPSVMRDGIYPDPRYLIGPTCDTSERVIRECEGLSRVRIEAPRSYAPPLPFRANGKLYFPYGEMTGVWTHAELRYALSCGYKLREIQLSLYSTQACSPFRDYVSSLYDKRADAKARGSPEEAVFKLMMNSLYGKFGQRSDTKMRLLCPIAALGEQDDLTGCEIVPYGDDLFLAKPLGGWGEATFVNVLWAAQITSLVRIRLHEAILAVDEDVIYTDTDSLMTPQALPVSPELGALGLEKGDFTARIVAPKMYAYVDAKGEWVYRCKGIPASQRASFFADGIARFSRPLGFLEAAVRRDIPGRWVEVVKHVQDTPPKRFYYRVADTAADYRDSRPFDVSSLPVPVSP